jgi:hypothetical protein
MSLEHPMKVLRTEVEPELLSLLPEDGGIRYSGTAEKLDEALTLLLLPSLLRLGETDSGSLATGDTMAP